MEASREKERRRILVVGKVMECEQNKPVTLRKQGTPSVPKIAQRQSWCGFDGVFVLICRM